MIHLNSKIINLKNQTIENSEKITGLAFVVDITRSEKYSVLLEKPKNGMIKNKLLDKIIKNAQKVSDEITIFKRSYSIIFFLEKNSDELKETDELLSELYFTCVDIIKKHNEERNEEIFKGSYGADFSNDNVAFTLNNRKEIFGKSINLAYKLAMHEENQQSFYVGEELSKYVKVEKSKNFRVVKGLDYWGYKKITTNNQGKRKYTEKRNKNPKRLVKDDGIIYFVIDLVNSTKALFKFDIWDVFDNYIEILIKIYMFLDSKNYRSEFRGDGFIFWKTKTFKKIKNISKALMVANKIDNNEFFGMKKDFKDFETKNEKVKNITINRLIKLKIGIDVAKRYLCIKDSLPPLSPHKILAELCEKNANQESSIVVGSSFLSILGINDKDYSKILKVINNYELKAFKNKHHKKSGLNNKSGLNWKHKVFPKNHNIDFEHYNVAWKNSNFKHYGKDARKSNEAQIRLGKKVEKVKYSGLHFYITSNGDVLDIFVNDSKGEYIDYK